MRLRRIKNLSSEFRMTEPGIRKQSAFTRLRRVNLRPKRKFLCYQVTTINLHHTKICKKLPLCYFIFNRKSKYFCKRTRTSLQSVDSLQLSALTFHLEPACHCPACFRFPKSGLRVPGFGKMRTPEFRRIGNSRCEALRAGRPALLPGGARRTWHERPGAAILQPSFPHSSNESFSSRYANPCCL